MTHITQHSRSRRKTYAGALIVVLLSVLAAICLPSRSAAAATVVAPRPEGPPLARVPGHIEPEAFDPRSKESAKAPRQQGPLVYRGGPVQDYTKTYVIFWLPAGYTFDTRAGDSYYEGLITRYLTDVNASSFYNTVTQYGDSFAWIRPNSTLADVAIDTTPYPVRSGQVFTTDSDIQAEVVKWIRARGWIYGQHEQFLVYTAAGVPTWESHLGWSTDKHGYCAYHTYFNSGGEVFSEEKDAADILSALIKHNSSGLSSTLQALVKRLVAADRALADIAIGQAIGAGGRPNQITQAQSQLTQGDTSAGAGKYAAAINHYRNAWQHAQAAMR